jgi:branched-chain amino acid transport system ATP-binding protein
MTNAIELKDLRKSLARPRSSAAPTWRCSGRARGHHRPQRRGQVHLFNLISGRLTHQRRGAANGQRIDGKTPYEINRLGLARSFQITNVPQAQRVREPALRRAVEPGLPLHLLALLSGLHDANERAESCCAKSAWRPSATCWPST